MVSCIIPSTNQKHSFTLFDICRRRRKKPTTPTTTTTMPKVDRGYYKDRLSYLEKKIRRNRLKLKIIQELQQIEQEENNEGGLQEKLFQTIFGQSADNYNSGSTSIFEKLKGDQSLSHHDFIHELTKWFRRSIWFLAFTAAYTVSPTILIITVSLSKTLLLSFSIVS